MHSQVGDDEMSIRFPMATSPDCMLMSVEPLLSSDTRSDWSPLATDLKGKEGNKLSIFQLNSITVYTDDHYQVENSF